MSAQCASVVSEETQHVALLGLTANHAFHARTTHSAVWTQRTRKKPSTANVCAIQHLWGMVMCASPRTFAPIQTHRIRSTVTQMQLAARITQLKISDAFVTLDMVEMAKRALFKICATPTRHRRHSVISERLIVSLRALARTTASVKQARSNLNQ